MNKRSEVWAAVTLAITLVWFISQCTMLHHVIR